MRSCIAFRKKFEVQNRNTDVLRHFKMQLNLVIQKKLARIQAAGVNGFVKRLKNSLKRIQKNPALK